MVACQACPLYSPPHALCLLAGLSYATYATTNQRMVSGASPAAVTATVFTLAALLAVPGALGLSGTPQLRVDDAVIVVWLGVVSTGIAYLLFSHALRHISAATGVVLALAEPVTAFVLAIVVVGERPGLAGVLGLAAVLVGLWVVVRSELRPRVLPMEAQRSGRETGLDVPVKKGVARPLR